MRNQKSDLLKLLSVFVASAFIVFAAGNQKLAAQQSAHMPYDLHFIDMMVIHHQEGIEMAQLAETKASKAAVKAFATKTGAEQQKDIEELQRYRNQWYAGKPIMDHATMMSMMQKMHPGMKMDMEDTRRKLRATSGPAFDRLFLDTMSHHHMMAVELGKDAESKAEHAEIKDFARKGVTKQNAEIAEMKRLKGIGTSKAPTKAKPKPKTTHKH
jgi:uncharacterized protein (DUF305 family)